MDHLEKLIGIAPVPIGSSSRLITCIAENGYESGDWSVASIRPALTGFPFIPVAEFVDVTNSNDCADSLMFKGDRPQVVAVSEVVENSRTRRLFHSL